MPSDVRRSSKVKLEVFSKRKLLRDKMIGALEDNIQTLLGLGGNRGGDSQFWLLSEHLFSPYSRWSQALQGLEIPISWDPV